MARLVLATTGAFLFRNGQMDIALIFMTLALSSIVLLPLRTWTLQEPWLIALTAPVWLICNIQVFAKVSLMAGTIYDLVFLVASLILSVTVPFRWRWRTKNVSLS